MFMHKMKELSNNQSKIYKESFLNEYTLGIVKLILSNNCVLARKSIRGAISENMEDAFLYNLYAISYEMEGDRLKASKFYRVAYYVDQSFKASKNNLDRISKFNYVGQGQIDWGFDISEVSECK